MDTDTRNILIVAGIIALILVAVGIWALIQVIKGVRERRRIQANLPRERQYVTFYKEIGGLDIVFYLQKPYPVSDPKQNPETHRYEGIISVGGGEVKVEYFRGPLEIVDSQFPNV